MTFSANQIVKQVFQIKDDQSFEEVALAVFKYQYQNIPVYHSYCDLLNRHPKNVKTLFDIPCLPIECFKKHSIIDGQEEIVFTSSGTTGNEVSKHFVKDLEVYENSFRKAFELFYGPIDQYTFLGLLPAYAERTGSSLIYMVDDFVQSTSNKSSDITLNLDQSQIDMLCNAEVPTFLIGVSFALLDLAEKGPFQFKNCIVMETGGMKGRRKEITREELHGELKSAFSVDQIHSEYGMTELLSQAYLQNGTTFKTPPWMKVWIRETDNPLSQPIINKTGGINIIDLANIHSCSFIATQDLGKTSNNNQFEVLGRFDAAQLRGCNLMVQ